MSDLRPNLRELVGVTKRVIQPTESDSARVLQTLRDRFGDATIMGIGTGNATAATALSKHLVAKILATCLGGLALSGGIWLLTVPRHQAGSTVTYSVSSVAASPLVPVATTDPATAAAPPVPSMPEASSIPATAAATSEHVEVRPSTPHHPRDSLREEATLLSRATAAMNSGKLELALKILGEHERRFGGGILAEERIAARAVALCRIGRTADANAQLAKISSSSAHAEFVRKGCRLAGGK